MNNKLTAVIATAVATTIIGAGVITVLAIKSSNDARKIMNKLMKDSEELYKEEQEICK